MAKVTAKYIKYKYGKVAHLMEPWTAQVAQDQRIFYAYPLCGASACESSETGPSEEVPVCKRCLQGARRIIGELQEDIDYFKSAEGI